MIVFENNGMEFNILLVGSIDTTRKLQVWFKWHEDGEWQFGHSKILSDVQSAYESALVMKDYLTGVLIPV